MFDFDKIIDRCDTDSVKYDGVYEEFGCSDVLPMWVADMDFEVAPCIKEAVLECGNRGVYGYTFRSQEGKKAFCGWVERRHGWKVETSWLSSSPGVVTALALAVRAFTRVGDKILIMTPVYPPFFSVVQGNARELVCSSLHRENGRYGIDWDNLETGLKSGVKMMILCNSHNPVGREWTREELKKVGDLCCKYDVLILSDEIHADLTLPGFQHTVMASVSPEIAERTLTAMAPSKTFNIAGMMNSVVIASNPKLLERYNRELFSLHLDSGNIFGHVALKAAYRCGDAWLDEMLRYINVNIDIVENYLNSELPEVKMYRPEGSFLLWLDFNETGLTHEECGRRLLQKGKIALNDGLTLGEEGRGFRRMNIGCPRKVVQQGLERISQALKRES